MCGWEVWWFFCHFARGRYIYFKTWCGREIERLAICKENMGAWTEELWFNFTWLPMVTYVSYGCLLLSFHMSWSTWAEMFACCSVKCNTDWIIHPHQTYLTPTHCPLTFLHRDQRSHWHPWQRGEHSAEHRHTDLPAEPLHRPLQTEAGTGATVTDGLAPPDCATAHAPTAEKAKGGGKWKGCTLKVEYSEWWETVQPKKGTN